MTVATLTNLRARTFAANRARGKISLGVAVTAGRSRRKRVYEDGALRVRFPNGEDLQAVVVNTAGGVAGGDRFALDIAVEEGAQLVVTTAAAEKVYRSLGDDSVVDVSLAVGPGATLDWLPQETIVFDEARLARSIEADLAPDARLLLAEAVVFGRTAMDEVVRTGRFIDRWRIRRDGRLIFADTTRLDGAVADKLGARAIAAGGCAVATVFLSPAGDDVALAVRAQDYAGDVGISVWNGIALARLVARDGDTLRRDLKTLLAACGATLPRLWLN